MEQHQMLGVTATQDAAIGSRPLGKYRVKSKLPQRRDLYQTCLGARGSDPLGEHGALGGGSNFILQSVRELIIRLPVQSAPGFRFPYSAPLLKEKCHVARVALVSQRSHPLLLHRPSTNTALAAHNYPTDSR